MQNQELRPSRYFKKEEALAPQFRLLAKLHLLTYTQTFFPSRINVAITLPLILLALRHFQCSDKNYLTFFNR